MLYLADIKSYHTFEKIEKIEKGWSSDRKFYIETYENKRLLLKVADISNYQQKKFEFEMMNKVYDLNVVMSKPIEFGTCNNGKEVYSLFSWCDGDDAKNVIPYLTETEQYVLGLKYGQELKKIHSIPAPENLENWESKFSKKADRKVKKYNESKIRFSGDDKIISYINKNRYLLKGRPQCFHHGDYHVGNAVINESKNLLIIDFNRLDYGDPWEEFNRIVFSAKASPYFATGQINGYFDGNPPVEFFKLLAFYIAVNTLSSVYWALDFDQKEMDFMLGQAKDVLSWYNNMENPIPSWYMSDFHIQYIDNVPFKLKSSFDFTFLNKYGKVFKVFDDQTSGNICFGIEKENRKYFVKFAGAPTEQAEISPIEAIENLKQTVNLYKDLEHRHLIKYVSSEEIGGGFAVIFEWVNAECMGRMYPLSRKKFTAMSLENKLKVYKDVLEFHDFVVSKGYVAIDFYDASIMFDFENNQTIICDIDVYAKTPFKNKMGKMWGSSRFMSPEELELGANIDEVTNVYTMGATAFALFSNYDRTKESWKLSEELYQVVLKAVDDDRSKRQQSIKLLFEEWTEKLNRMIVVKI